MQTLLIKNHDRGSADFGWLKAKYTFSFANYYNPNYMQFGALRVLNDDLIAPLSGFPTHPHSDMEIITIPLAGKLRHEDSTGKEGVITAGEIQVMSAGTGIQHSEANPSADETLNLLQIWVFPRKNGLEPRYDQMKYELENNANEFVNLIHPYGENNALSINQDAYFYMGKFDENTKYKYAFNKTGHGLFAFILEGSAWVAEQSLQTKDALCITETDAVSLDIASGSQILLMELPLN